MPPAARGPVFTVSRPILSGALCAIEGMGKKAAPAAAVAPATKRRRVVLMMVMASSRGSDVLMQPQFLDAGSCGRNSIIMLRRSEPPIEPRSRMNGLGKRSENRKHQGPAFEIIGFGVARSLIDLLPDLGDARQARFALGGVREPSR